MFLFALLMLAGLALCDTTITYQTCLTKLGAASKAKVGSTTYALTIPVTKKRFVTSTPSTSITLAAVTQVSTITNTQTVSVTTTTTAGVYTVPTPAGFVPIGGAAAKRALLPGRRRAAGAPQELAARAATVTSALVSNGKIVCKPTQYPQAVTCAKLVENVRTVYSTKTASTTTTITVTPLPSTSVTTTTVTATTTITEVVPTQTVYAACQANNFVPGGAIGYNSQICGNAYFSYGNAASAYDCCVSCQTTANCQGGLGGGGICFLVIASNCVAGGSSGTCSGGGGGDGTYYNFNGNAALSVDC